MPEPHIPDDIPRLPSPANRPTSAQIVVARAKLAPALLIAAILLVMLLLLILLSGIGLYSALAPL